MGRGQHRGFMTIDELTKSLGKRNLNIENLEKAFIHILDEKIVLVGKKSDFKAIRKKEGTIGEDSKTSDKSDDPIRMYLREMGGVELLSREGEIAIAKRIEAGKDVMLNALSSSPITAQKVLEWNAKLLKNEILVREIIDIDTNYTDEAEIEDGEKTHKKDKEKKEDNKKEESENSVEQDNSEDEFNPTLAAMENEIRPKVLKTILNLTKNYRKLTKYQNERLNAVLESKKMSPGKEKGYKKIIDEILEQIKSLQLSPSVLEELVQSHYVENKKNYFFRRYTSEASDR